LIQFILLASLGLHMHSQPGFRGIPAAGPSTSSSWWCLPRKAKNPTLLTVNLPYITCLASSHTFTTFHLVTVFLHPKSGSNVLRLQHGMAPNRLNLGDIGDWILLDIAACNLLAKPRRQALWNAFVDNFSKSTKSQYCRGRDRQMMANAGGKSVIGW